MTKEAANNKALKTSDVQNKAQATQHPGPIILVELLTDVQDQKKGSGHFTCEAYLKVANLKNGTHYKLRGTLTDPSKDITVWQPQAQ